ncbi:LolE-like permease protein [hydrothermal vent metagenome]|uniref:LolE-like permease protein n=1 Tax=hydrothermal vent metagenome TaxID=652676 RepID=A0A3B0QZL0_9ZZZZ
MYLKLAFKNIFRNKVRSAITLGAIAFGCLSLIITGGFIEDTFTMMRESYIRSFLGHMQVYKQDFYEKGSATPYDYMIPDYKEISKKIKEVDGVSHVTPRLDFSGLLSIGETTISFIGQGIDPEGEALISTSVKMDKGQGLSAGDSFDTILGRGLAKAVGVEPGSSVIVVTNTISGAMNGLDLNVKGIFSTSSKAFDDRALRMPLKTAHRLLRTDQVQSLVVLLDKTEDTDRVKAALQKRFKEDGDGLEVITWYEMADFYNKTVELYNRQFFVLKLIIGIVVVLSIFNTMNMSVMERVGEVGTIMALGTRRSGVVRLFILEGLILGVLGGLIGVVSGYILANIISYIGIPMPPPPGATMSWTATIGVVPKVFVFVFVLAIVTSLFSSVYPALKASKLEISEALRHNV